MIGRIKFFDMRKRIGFIIPDGKTYRDKADVFFHESKVDGGVRGTIEEGTEVEYEPIPNVRDKALFVKVTGARYAPVHELRKGVAHGD